MSEQKMYKSTESPAVLLSLPSIIKPRQEFKLRIIQYSKSGPLLDIREYLNQPGSTRFTKKGVTLSLDHMWEMRVRLDEAFEFIAKNCKDPQTQEWIKKNYLNNDIDPE